VASPCYYHAAGVKRNMPEVRREHPRSSPAVHPEVCKGRMNGNHPRLCLRAAFRNRAQAFPRLWNTGEGRHRITTPHLPSTLLASPLLGKGRDTRSFHPCPGLRSTVSVALSVHERRATVCTSKHQICRAGCNEDDATDATAFTQARTKTIRRRASQAQVPMLPRRDCLSNRENAQYEVGTSPASGGWDSGTTSNPDVGTSLRAEPSNLPPAGLRLLRRCASRNDMS